MSNRNFRIIIFPSPIPKIFLLQVSLNLLLPPRFQVYSNRVMSIVIMNTKSSNQQDRNLITPKL
jgi:predicted solute-binding protein